MEFQVATPISSLACPGGRCREQARSFEKLTAAIGASRFKAGRESYAPSSWEVVFEGEDQFEAGLAAAGGGKPIEAWSTV